MALATWWQHDPLPYLTTHKDFYVQAAHDVALLSRVTGVAMPVVAQRLEQGHLGYIAWMGHDPVSSGWVATRYASIGELHLTMTLPSSTRYLWDFATVPAWRGQGHYPRLLQAILQAAPHEGEQWWILHAPENLASARGIVHAGFQRVGEVSFHPTAGVALVPSACDERADEGAALLHISALTAQAGHDLAPCWRCVNVTALTPATVTCWQAALQATTAASGCACTGQTAGHTC